MRRGILLILILTSLLLVVPLVSADLTSLKAHCMVIKARADAFHAEIDKFTKESEEYNNQPETFAIYSDTIKFMKKVGNRCERTYDVRCRAVINSSDNTIGNIIGNNVNTNVNADSNDKLSDMRWINSWNGCDMVVAASYIDLYEYSVALHSCNAKIRAYDKEILDDIEDLFDDSPSHWLVSSTKRLLSSFRLSVKYKPIKCAFNATPN